MARTRTGNNDIVLFQFIQRLAGHLSIAHDLTGPCSTRVDRFWSRSKGGGDASVGGVAGGPGDAVPGDLRALSRAGLDVRAKRGSAGGVAEHLPALAAALRGRRRGWLGGSAAGQAVGPARGGGRGGARARAVRDALLRFHGEAFPREAGQR